MDFMDKWCIDHHGASGLTQKVLNSQKTVEEVEAELLGYLHQHVGRAHFGILAGNSIHQDKMFLAREFPKVIDYLHYRMVDVTSFKEILKRHNPVLHQQVPRKLEAHTARADILESIGEMRWYMNNYLRGPQGYSVNRN